MVKIINRWMKWVFASVIIASVINYFGWLNRSVSVLFLMAFFSWFLIETVYYWMSIKVLSKSNFPLFPHFIKSYNDTDKAWPTQVKLLKAKDWVSSNNFKQKDFLVADYMNIFKLRCIVFDNLDNNIRLQILLTPLPKGGITAFYSFISLMDSGVRVISDNIAIPFGGFYPKDWSLKRRPLTSSIDKLYKFHLNRIKKEEGKTVFIDADALEDLNNQQNTLKKVNKELGFFNPQKYHSFYGRISGEGCYRIWKEIWLIKYLGMSMY